MPSVDVALAPPPVPPAVPKAPPSWWLKQQHEVEKSADEYAFNSMVSEFKDRQRTDDGFNICWHDWSDEMFGQQDPAFRTPQDLSDFIDWYASEAC